MDFAAWLLEEIDRQYEKHADFARQAGVRDQKVSSWIAGTKPTMPSIMSIARGLHMDWRRVAARAGYEVPDKQTPRSSDDILAELEAEKPVPVPIVQNLMVHAGTGGTVFEYYYLPPRYRRGKKVSYVGVIAQGDCMEPLIAAGD